MKIQIQQKKGFILFITLMMLIVFAVLGLRLYQQVTMSSQNIQYITFKQEAEDLAMRALNDLEASILSNTNKEKAVCNAEKDLGSGEAVDKERYCEPLSDDAINNALTQLRHGEDLVGNVTDHTWAKMADEIMGSFSNNGDVHYTIQQLGEGMQDDRYLLFRITIIARVLDTFSVISAVTAVPKNEVPTNP